MSRKHNTKHLRSKSRYPERLRKRGVTNVEVRMLDLESLRKIAARNGQYVAPVEEAA